jgi:hypothetical protein
MVEIIKCFKMFKRKNKKCLIFLQDRYLLKLQDKIVIKSIIVFAKSVQVVKYQKIYQSG